MFPGTSSPSCGAEKKHLQVCVEQESTDIIKTGIVRIALADEHILVDYMHAGLMHNLSCFTVDRNNTMTCHLFFIDQ